MSIMTYLGIYCLTYHEMKLKSVLIRKLLNNRYISFHPGKRNVSCELSSNPKVISRLYVLQNRLPYSMNAIEILQTETKVAVNPVMLLKSEFWLSYFTELDIRQSYLG